MGDEAVRRVKVALAEMGWVDADVHALNRETVDGEPNVFIQRTVPKPVAFQALAVTLNTPCWSCWSHNSGSREIALGCLRGDCANLGPKRPPRELLVSA